MLRRLLHCSFAFALLFAQTLGTLHAVAHARGPARIAQLGKAAPAPVIQLAGLFQAHDDAGSCRLFDQLSHGDTSVGAAAPVPVVALAAPVTCASRSTWSAPAAPGGPARAPPFLG